MPSNLSVHDANGGGLLGCVTYRRGLVTPGQIGAVRTPAGIVLRRVFYYRDGGREMVRLASLAPAVAPLCFPLADVEVLGPVLACAGADPTTARTDKKIRPCPAKPSSAN